MLELMPNLQTFLTVAELNSFSAAGRKLNMANSSISRHISQLEEGLKTSLFIRSTRSVRLSASGEILKSKAISLLADIEDLQDCLSTGTSTVSGLLRISAPWRYARIYIGPIITRFLDLYPNIRVEIASSDNLVNLIEDKYDVALRLSQLKDSNLIAKKIGEQEFAIVGSPLYLEKHKDNPTHSDLADHDMVSFSFNTPHYSWQLRKGGKTFRLPIKDSKLISNNADILTQAAIDGAGLMIQPLWAIQKELEQGTLVQILKDYQVTSTSFHSGIYSVYTKENRHNPLVRAWVDFLSEHFKK